METVDMSEVKGDINLNLFHSPDSCVVINTNLGDTNEIKVSG